MIRKFTKNIFFHLNKGKYKFTPFFIIGCGRSGTTVLGETLSSHPDIKYLNERRDIWHLCYPEFNIWEETTNKRILVADKRHADITKNQKLKNLFFREQVSSKSSILLEKLPINSFRLEFLKSSFPDAKFIYLTRNGLEVSKSIEKKIKKKKWYTGNKFNLIKEITCEDLAKTKLELDVEKGMLEWRMSMSQSDHFFKKIKTEDFIHLSYEDLINNTEKTISTIFSFLNLELTTEVQNASNKIQRKNNIIKDVSCENLKKIGGSFLDRSINNTYSPI